MSQGRAENDCPTVAPIGGGGGADGLLETSVPGVYAAGDVRAGSMKRCATAVGEGATVVRFVHERLAARSAAH